MTTDQHAPTPEQRARKLAASLFDGTILTESRLAVVIAAAFRQAEAAAYERGWAAGQVEEREACALIADDIERRAYWGSVGGNARGTAAREIQTAIKARGTGGQHGR